MIVTKIGVQDNIDSVKDLLRRAGLPLEDIDEHLSDFITAEYDGRIVGVIGLEACGKVGLLRSLAVDVGYRSRNIGSHLVKEMIGYTQNLKIEKLLLITTTARDYFEKFGFAMVDRENVPSEVKNTRQFQGICPVSAICMEMTLSHNERNHA